MISSSWMTYFFLTNYSPETQTEGPQGPAGEHGTMHLLLPIRSAQMRICSRAVDSHQRLVNQMTERYGYDGAHVPTVLEHICPQKLLHFRRIRSDVQERLKSRLLLATFWLSDEDWHQLSRFFQAIAPEHFATPPPEQDWRKSLNGWPRHSSCWGI